MAKRITKRQAAQKNRCYCKEVNLRGIDFDANLTTGIIHRRAGCRKMKGPFDWEPKAAESEAGHVRS
jgi:hypothetical protein